MCPLFIPPVFLCSTENEQLPIIIKLMTDSLSAQWKYLYAFFASHTRTNITFNCSPCSNEHEPNTQPAIITYKSIRFLAAYKLEHSACMKSGRNIVCPFITKTIQLIFRGASQPEDICLHFSCWIPWRFMAFSIQSGMKHWMINRIPVKLKIDW